MKLSKEELKDLLNARIEWHLDNAEFLRSQGLSGKKNDDLCEKYEAFLNKLEDGTLEIEGYERSEWTRLDPDDPKTYPKESTPVLFASYNPIDKWGMLAEIASDDVIDNWKNISRLFGVVFWQEVMFPNPTVESEE